MIVLDTSVVSFIFNGDSRAAFYEDRIRTQQAVISFQTAEELWFGAYRAGWGLRRRNELQRFLGQFVVISPSPDMARLCGRLRGERERQGLRLETADGWIAATALYLDCPLASHDGDFDGIPQLRLVRAP